MKKFTILPVIVVILISVVIVRAIYKSESATRTSNYTTLLHTYPLLSQRILQENQNDLLIHFVELRKQLREQVTPYGDSFAFHFEYLPTGISIGVNEKTDFSLNSLLKVPLVMAYYDGVERSGIEVQQDVIITEDQIDDRFGSLWERGAGTHITLAEAARLALVDSDNTAAIVLAKHVNNQDYVDVYNGLDITLPENISDPVSLSAKGYSSILKALYFSSILNKDHSQAILKMLTETKFTDKLAAGVPGDITVAHKIGVEDKVLYQDCGIIFAPRRPYALCMFSKSDEDTARTRMKLLSETIYHFISTENE